MVKKWDAGDKAFIVESSRFIREVTIIKSVGGLVTLRFADTNGGVKLHESRLLPTKEEAEASTKKKSWSRPFYVL